MRCSRPLPSPVLALRRGAAASFRAATIQDDPAARKLAVAAHAGDPSQVAFERRAVAGTARPVGGGGDRSTTLALAPTAAAPEQARAGVAALLEGLHQELRFRARLLVSELVANSVRHADL